MTAKNKTTRDPLKIPVNISSLRCLRVIKEYLGPPPYRTEAKKVPVATQREIVLFMDGRYPTLTDRRKAKRLGIPPQTFYSWRKQTKRRPMPAANPPPSEPVASASAEEEVAPFIFALPRGEVRVWNATDAAALVRELSEG